MKKLIALMILLGLSGCGFVFQDLNERDYENLTYKMSKEDVIKMLGVPRKKSKLIIIGKEYEVWEYPQKESGPRAVSSLATFTSRVFFQDGLVLEWRQDRVYAQPEYDYTETFNPSEIQPF